MSQAYSRIIIGYKCKTIRIPRRNVNKIKDWFMTRSVVIRLSRGVAERTTSSKCIGEDKSLNPRLHPTAFHGVAIYLCFCPSLLMQHKIPRERSALFHSCRPVFLFCSAWSDALGRYRTVKQKRRAPCQRPLKGVKQLTHVYQIRAILMLPHGAAKDCASIKQQRRSLARMRSGANYKSVPPSAAGEYYVER